MTDIDKLRDEIKKLREEIQLLTLTCGRMDKHISFIDKVYGTVKTPLEYVVNSLTPSLWVKGNILPEIEYNPINDINDFQKLVCKPVEGLSSV
jgi:hypothetical protein